MREHRILFCFLMTKVILNEELLNKQIFTTYSYIPIHPYRLTGTNTFCMGNGQQKKLTFLLFDTLHNCNIQVINLDWKN